MSFTSDIKKELTTIEPGKKCCQLAQISCFLRLAGSVKIMGGKPGLKVTSDNPAVARVFVKMIKEYFGSKSSLSVEEPEGIRSRLYNLTITPEMNSESILRETGILAVKEGYNYFPDGLSQEILKKRCCKKAALRGIFLAAGNISDPAKGNGYHLEFSFESEELSRDVIKIMNSFGLKAKSIVRKGRYVVYVKDGEQIEDFLSVIGASTQLFQFQNIRITKEMRNTANRIVNCDTANEERKVSAALAQIADIKYIENSRGLDYLPGKLRQTALMRMEHQDLSLGDLAAMFNPPLTKSGVNNRLAKISAIAENLRKTE